MKKNKMTYAQVADKLTKKIGELEKKAKSSDRFARETAKQMLPRYQEKLDALYNAQEQSKQADMQKDIQAFQMKWGGDLEKYNLGGDIGAGVAGFVGGAVGSIPIVGDMLQQGVYNLHEKIDGDVSDQEKSIRGYGAAAGGIGAGIATGNPMAAMGALGDVQEGYMYGQSPNPMGYAYGGKLPKMNVGGPIIPESGEKWVDFLARAQAAGIPEQDTWDPVSGTMIPGAMNMYNNPDARMEKQTKYTAPGFRPEMQDSGMKDANGNPIMVHTAKNPIKPNQAMLDRAANGDMEAQRYIDNYNQNTSPGAVKNTDGTYTIPGVAYPEQEDYTQPKFYGSNDQPQGGNNSPMGWQDLLYKGAAYSPTAYNFARGLQKPQVLEAEDFQNPYESDAMRLMANRRFNIDPQLQANRSTFNQMRGGLKNVAGGNAATYLSNMGQLQMNKGKMDEQAYAMKQNMDNQYKAQDAQFRGNMGNVRAQRELQIQDINDRNKAARDAHMGKGFEGLSKIAQNEKYMGNMSAADQQRIALLQNMPWDFVPQFDENNMMTGYKYMGS